MRFLRGRELSCFDEENHHSGGVEASGVVIFLVGGCPPDRVCLYAGQGGSYALPHPRSLFLEKSDQKTRHAPFGQIPFNRPFSGGGHDPRNSAVTWWQLRHMDNTTHALYPPKKRAQGFDVVRYRRRCGEPLGCFGVCAGSRTRRGEKVALFSETPTTPMLGTTPKYAHLPYLPFTREPFSFFSSTNSFPKEPTPLSQSQLPPHGGPQRSRWATAARPQSGRESGRSPCEDGPSRERRGEGQGPFAFKPRQLSVHPRREHPALHSQDGADAHSA